MKLGCFICDDVGSFEVDGTWCSCNCITAQLRDVVPSYLVPKNQTDAASAGTPNRNPSTVPDNPPITPSRPMSASSTNGSATYHFVTGGSNG